MCSIYLVSSQQNWKVPDTLKARLRQTHNHGVLLKYMFCYSLFKLIFNYARSLKRYVCSLLYIVLHDTVDAGILYMSYSRC